MSAKKGTIQPASHPAVTRPQELSDIISEQLYRNIYGGVSVLEDPVSFQAFKNPVVASDGQVYEMDTFRQLLTRGGGVSPITKRKLDPNPIRVPTIVGVGKHIHELEEAVKRLIDEREKKSKEEPQRPSTFKSSATVFKDVPEQSAVAKQQQQQQLTIPEFMVQPINTSYTRYAGNLSEYQQTEKTKINRYIASNVVSDTAFSPAKIDQLLITRYWPRDEKAPVTKILLPFPFNPQMASVSIAGYINMISSDPTAWANVIMAVFPDYAADTHIIHLVYVFATTNPRQQEDLYFWVRDYEPTSARYSQRGISRDQMAVAFDRMTSQRQNMPILTNIDRYLNSGVRVYGSYPDPDLRATLNVAESWPTPSPSYLLDLLSERYYEDQVPAEYRTLPKSTFVSMPYITSVAPLGCLTGPRELSIDLGTPIVKGNYSITLRSTMWINNVSIPCCVILYPLPIDTDDESAVIAEAMYSRSFADHGLTKCAMVYAYNHVNSAGDNVINKVVPLRVTDWLCKQGCFSSDVENAAVTAAAGTEMRRGSLSIFIVSEFQTSVRSWLRAPLMSVSQSSNYAKEALKMSTEIKWRAAELRNLIVLLYRQIWNAFGGVKGGNEIFYWAGGMNLMSCGLLLDYTTNNPVSLIMHEWHPRSLLSTMKLIEDTEILVNSTNNNNNPFNVKNPQLSSAYKMGFRHTEFAAATAYGIYNTRFDTNNERLLGNCVAHHVWARFILCKFAFELFVETLDTLGEIEGHLDTRPDIPSDQTVQEARYAVNSNKLSVLDELKTFLDALTHVKPGPFTQKDLQLPTNIFPEKTY